ncbi:endonuclease domain-containing protein [Microbacterium bovistercoris]|nr:DUF559 domain-containing protein [Microbacterium bovistercoris]
MRHRIALPPELGDRFSVRQAAAAGVGRGRHDAADLARPFHGVRSVEAPETFRARVRCYLPRLRANQVFAGQTARRLWGLPGQPRWHPDELLEISVRTGSTPPRTTGVRGRRLVDGRVTTWRIGSVPVIDPIAAVFMDAASLTSDEAVILIDALITDAENYPDLVHGRPRVTPLDIEMRLREWGTFPGCRKIADALSRAREHVESPKETETRLLLIAAGLPEPVVQHEVHDGARLIARIDLAYPELKIAIEYEGDGHRTDKEQWRRDIERQRELEDRGWIVIRLTQHDLRVGKASLLARIRRAIAARF